MFPTTRVILDATETPIKKPVNVETQRATFSTYKHRNTAKTMNGITPNGFVLSQSHVRRINQRPSNNRAVKFIRQGCI